MGVEQRLIDGEFVDLKGATIAASSIRDLLIADRLDPRGIRLRDARVEGALDLADIHSKRPLVLLDCRTDSPVLLDRANLSSVDLSGLVAPAVSAAWLRLDHYLLMQDVRLDGGTAEWAVDLAEAQIGSHLSLRGAHLTGIEYALHAPKLRTGSQVFLTDLRASGTVRLDGARIGGNLRGEGAHIHSATNAAFLGVDMQVDDNLFLSRGFHARTDSTGLAAVRIRGSRLGGQLVLRGGKATGAIALDLKHTRAGMEILFATDVAEGLVDLDGLTYVGVPRDATLPEWLDLLAHRTRRYASQPYLHLAAAHQAAGNERDVRRVRVAQQKDLLRRGTLTRWGRLWHRVTGATVGYGYRPAIALLWLAATLTAAIVLVVAVAGPSGLTRATTGPCSTVEQIGLALNAATPLVKPDTQQRCQIITTTGLGQFVVITTWLLQALAWAFATLFVAGFTGLVRKTT
ncbi:hypothetical protein ACFFQW_22845 [Umezawaea endophytica]|uniref:Uncharacterized protein n=1 Tax=Umezawaea endophytica TaxID=1654476 RepID=A0A9X2VRB3_9PSEU|nr:hypothetical protein [Umezawaea endophytica]MCS7481458.1 hypothetical protein [Umezawaea endophytica]